MGSLLARVVAHIQVIAYSMKHGHHHIEFHQEMYGAHDTSTKNITEKSEIERPTETPLVGEKPFKSKQKVKDAIEEEFDKSFQPPESTVELSQMEENPLSTTANEGDANVSDASTSLLVDSEGAADKADASTALLEGEEGAADVSDASTSLLVDSEGAADKADASASLLVGEEGAADKADASTSLLVGEEVESGV